MVNLLHPVHLGIEQEDRHGARAVGADDERLFDVGRLGRARDEQAVAWLVERMLSPAQPVVRLVQVVQQVGPADDQHDMLGDEVNRPVRHDPVRHPHGSVLRDGKLAGQNRDLNVFKMMRVEHLREVDIAKGQALDRTDHFRGSGAFGRLHYGQVANLRFQFGSIGRDERFAADEREHLAELRDGVGECDPVACEVGQFGLGDSVLADRGEDACSGRAG